MDRFNGNKPLGLIIGALIAIFLVLKLTGSSAAGVFLFIGAVVLAILVILVLIVTLFAIGKGKKDFDSMQTNRAGSEVPEEIMQAKTELLSDSRKMRRLKNMSVKAHAQKDYDLCNKIIETLGKQPDEIRRCPQFFSYYLPTFGIVLEKYLILEEGGVDLEKAVATTLVCLDNMQTALDKQYRNLFTNEMLDLTVEMNALDTIMKKDGFKE